MNEKKRNVVIAQSGGPTAVINASLCGAVEALREKGVSKSVGRILGAKHGIDGILSGDFVDLGSIRGRRFERIAMTPSAALGSSRRKPTPEDCAAILARFKEMDVGGFFYIGGNDSADTLRIVAEAARKDGYPLSCWHIPKTIDNDLRSCDHAPGYASAARFVASAVAGDDLDNRALGGVKIDVVMGRDSGFLAASAALARKRPDDGPHLIYLPEVPFSIEKFAGDVKAACRKFGRCVVVVSEGIRGGDGKSIAAKLGNGEKDSHGNVQMSGSGALGDALARAVREATGLKRVRADTFGYIQRSFALAVSKLDFEEAWSAGASAVQAAFGRGMRTGTIGIVRAKSKNYRAEYVAMQIEQAARTPKSMPKKFIARSGCDVTKAFVEYARPLVGDIPDTEVLV